MKKIKEKILEKSLELFNEFGASSVSMRQVAKELSMSHSNLLYHFKSKNELITALHDQLLGHAIELNKQVKPVEFDFVNLLYQSTVIGFSIVYEYRFLMLELNAIMKENESLKENFVQLEKVRAAMYRLEIEKAVRLGILRKEVIENEYEQLVHHIKIFSDSWIASAAIYDRLDKDQLIHKYALAMMYLFSPHMTEEGARDFSNWLSMRKN